MTSSELRTLFNESFGLGEWPEIYKVDTETYAYICNDIFQHKNEHNHRHINFITIAVGSHGGIMFKNVELIIG